jgi:hypothetical protein
MYRTNTRNNFQLLPKTFPPTPEKTSDINILKRRSRLKKKRRRKTKIPLAEQGSSSKIRKLLHLLEKRRERPLYLKG